jgi:hypothetical protein
MVGLGEDGGTDQGLELVSFYGGLTSENNVQPILNDRLALRS